MKDLNAQSKDQMYEGGDNNKRNDGGGFFGLFNFGKKAGQDNGKDSIQQDYNTMSEEQKKERIK